MVKKAFYYFILQFEVITFLDTFQLIYWRTVFDNFVNSDIFLEVLWYINIHLRLTNYYSNILNILITTINLSHKVQFL